MVTDLNTITLVIATLALVMPWLYDGSMFTRGRVWQRRFDRAERKRRKYTRAEIQDIRDKARRNL